MITPPETETLYDAAIVGGGLAGLSLSILLARAGYKVILFEKECYPFHRVCGEYISLESWSFLNSLGLDLDAIGVPIIKHLQVTDIGGHELQLQLPLGGFGISRYRLDHSLASLARAAGAEIREGVKVNDLSFSEGKFNIQANEMMLQSRLAFGSFGKRSNLDVKWKRPFITNPKSKLNNYVGVKYHVKIDFPADTIALHLFEDGYCGIVKIEGDEYNLCYLTTAANLRRGGGSIEEMERGVLGKNRYLAAVFEQAHKTNPMPITISQVSFDVKSLIQDHAILLGDAAGMITPLCGNGMSMALHASKLASTQAIAFLSGKRTRSEAEANYVKEWKSNFERRLRMGRRIQRLFGNKRLTAALLKTGKAFPFLIRYLVRQTHGKPF